MAKEENSITEKIQIDWDEEILTYQEIGKSEKIVNFKTKKPITQFNKSTYFLLACIVALIQKTTKDNNFRGVHVFDIFDFFVHHLGRKDLTNNKLYGNYWSLCSKGKSAGDNQKVEITQNGDKTMGFDIFKRESNYLWLGSSPNSQKCIIEFSYTDDNFTQFKNMVYNVFLKSTEKKKQFQQLPVCSGSTENGVIELWDHLYASTSLMELIRNAKKEVIFSGSSLATVSALVYENIKTIIEKAKYEICFIFMYEYRLKKYPSWYIDSKKTILLNIFTKIQDLCNLRDRIHSECENQYKDKSKNCIEILRHDELTHYSATLIDKDDDKDVRLLVTPYSYEMTNVDRPTIVCYGMCDLVKKYREELKDLYTNAKPFTMQLAENALKKIRKP